MKRTGLVRPTGMFLAGMVLACGAWNLHAAELPNGAVPIEYVQGDGRSTYMNTGWIVNPQTDVIQLEFAESFAGHALEFAHQPYELVVMGKGASIFTENRILTNDELLKRIVQGIGFRHGLDVSIDFVEFDAQQIASL